MWTSMAAKPARSKAAAISTWPLTPCSRRMATRGRGVPPHRRRSVFAPFERLDEQRPGTGLGLPVVQAIARGHGGEVEVRGRPDGPGAWFELRLPLAPRGAPRAAGEVGA